MGTAPVIERTTGAVEGSKQPLLRVIREVAGYITEMTHPDITTDGEEAGYEIAENAPIHFKSHIPIWERSHIRLVKGPFSWTLIPLEGEVTLVGEGELNIPIWERPHIRAMLRGPVGAPIKLTREEAIEIARSSFASEPDLTSGDEYVRKVRPLLGRAILEKFKKASG